MLQQVIERLDTAQRAELAKHGITYNRLWSWRTGQRLPTEVQTAYLAAATGSNWVELQKEVTVMRAPEAEREAIARTIGWHYTPTRETLGFRAGERPASTVPSA